MQELPRLKRGFVGELRLHLNDEAPAVGCGIRRLIVKVGSKKVTLINPYTKRRARMLRSAFEELVRAQRT